MFQLFKIEVVKAEVVISITLVALTLCLSLYVAGLPFISSLLIVFALVVFSLPWMILQELVGLWPANLTARIVVAAGMGTLTQALLFSFTPIAGNSGVFWGVNALIVGCSLLVRVGSHKQTGKQRKPETEFQAPILIACLSVLASSVLVRLASPISDGTVVPLPGDYALFAEWGRVLSSGAGPEGIIEGFTLRYHWLVYSWLGGLDLILGQSYLFGPVFVAPVVAWLGLSLGSVAVLRILSRSMVPAVLAVFAVMLSSNVGLSPFSMIGLGGLPHSSPSHLVSSFWLVASFLLGYELVGRSNLRQLTWIVLSLLGFSLMLSKATTAVILSVSLLVVSITFMRRHERKSFAQCVSVSAIRLSPLLAGSLVAYFLFISGTDSGIALDDRLVWTDDSSVIEFAVQLMPLLAYAFSVLVWVAPVFLLLRSRFVSEPIVLAAATLSVLGMVLFLGLEMPGSNETWLLQGSLILILPVSSFAVARTLSPLLSRRSHTKGFGVLLIAAVVLVVGGYALFTVRDAPYLLERPWLVPALSVAALLLLTFFVVSAIVDKPTVFGYGQGKSHVIVAFTVSFLFLLAIVFGSILRIHGALDSRFQNSQYEMFVSKWLNSAKERAISLEGGPSDTLLAVYSMSSGEVTLARWIPVLIQQKLYSMRVDDVVHRVFVPDMASSVEMHDNAGNSLMTQRQALIREYVENGDQAACNQLRRDGVSHIWLTPNTNFSPGSEIQDFEHSVVKISCERQ